MCHLLRSTRRRILQNQNEWYHFSQLLAHKNQRHHFSQLLASQLLAQFQRSRQLTQVHLCLKQAREQLELLDLLKDLMIMNCQDMTGLCYQRRVLHLYPVYHIMELNLIPLSTIEVFVLVSFWTFHYALKKRKRRGVVY